MSEREIVEILAARNTSDGAGVKLKRVFGGPQPERFDPFLMLDEIGSEDPADYRGGFPDHPHRGFETVTYLMKGKLEHRDHMGNVGLLEDGGVQWMTAGRGIIHSEMPRQTAGRLHGFQLWLNLPACEKMKPAGYTDIAPEEIPEFHFQGAQVKAIAGHFSVNGKTCRGFYHSGTSDAVLLHITLQAGHQLNLGNDTNHTCLVYNMGGDIALAENAVALKEKHLARLSGGDNLNLHNPGSAVTNLLLMAGRPLKEPIAQYGPFVMNTIEEVEQAIRDYQSGQLTSRT